MEYYQALLGSATSADNEQTKILQSPNWVRAFQDNSNFPSRPSRHVWHLFVQGKLLTMVRAKHIKGRDCFRVYFIHVVRNTFLYSWMPTLQLLGCLMTETWTLPLAQ
jgi:hypothetical protein